MGAKMGTVIKNLTSLEIQSVMRFINVEGHNAVELRRISLLCCHW